jgi:hypothetical protein
MLDILTRNPFISAFLSKYPKQSWKQCIESLVLYGIFTIQRDFEKGLSFDQLVKLTNLNPVSTPKSATPSLDLNKLREATTPQFKEPRPRDSLTTPRSHVQSAPRKPPIKQPPMKLNSGSLSGRSSSERKIPKYLKNVSSRIKSDVKKDIQEYRHMINSSLRESPRGDTSHRKIQWEDETQEAEEYREFKPESRRHSVQDHSQNSRNYSREKLEFKPEPEEYLKPRPNHSRSAQSLQSNKEIYISETYDTERPSTLTSGQEFISKTSASGLRSGSSSSLRGKDSKQEVVSTPSSVKPPPHSILKDAGYTAPQNSKWMPVSEPKIASLDNVQLYSRPSVASETAHPAQGSKEDPDNEIMRIAEEFLKNPFTSYLARNEGMFSVPTSPKVLESWIHSPQSNLITSIEMLSPGKFSEYGR